MTLSRICDGESSLGQVSGPVLLHADGSTTAPVLSRFPIQEVFVHQIATQRGEVRVDGAQRIVHVSLGVMAARLERLGEQVEEDQPR